MKTIALLFYRNTNPYVVDNKGNIQKELKVVNNQATEVPLVDKATWTNNIKVCFSVLDTKADVKVPSSLTKDFILEMKAEKDSAKAPFQFLPNVDYDLKSSSVATGTVDDKPVIFATYTPHGAKFTSKLSLAV
jgi:hypothetical protein